MSKPEWYQTFKEADERKALDRITWFQARVLLETIGVKRSNHPTGKKENVIRAIREAAERNPEKAQQAWETVILKKAPTAAPAKLSEDALDKITAQLADMVQQSQNEVTTLVKEDITDYAKSVINDIANQYRKVEVRTPGKKPKKMKYTLPTEFDTMLQLASQRVNMMLVGPAGCGKTFLAERVAEALGMDYAAQSCSEGVSESQFQGWLLPVGKSGQFSYVPAEFVNIYENGGVFLGDEMDNSDPNLMVFLNQALANDHFFIPQRFGKPRVNKHEDFIFIGAANTFGHGADAMYVGRNQLDAATLDRFRAGMILMDYSAQVEEAIVHPSVLEWGREVRSMVREHQMQRIMSTRCMVDLTKMTEGCEWERKDWNRAYFADWSMQDLSIAKARLSFGSELNVKVA